MGFVQKTRKDCSWQCFNHLLAVKYNRNLWPLLGLQEYHTLFPKNLQFLPASAMLKRISVNFRFSGSTYQLGDLAWPCVDLQYDNFVILPICTHTEQSRTASWVDILSGTLRLSHAPALLSGIFIPILQSTNRLWLAAAGAAGLHTRIRAGHHENCAANRNRTSCIQLHPGGSRVRVRHSQDINSGSWTLCKRVI